jgi:hypothetical protein
MILIAQIQVSKSLCYQDCLAFIEIKRGSA